MMEFVEWYLVMNSGDRVSLHPVNYRWRFKCPMYVQHTRHCACHCACLVPFFGVFSVGLRYSEVHGGGGYVPTRLIVFSTDCR